MAEDPKAAGQASSSQILQDLVLQLQSGGGQQQTEDFLGLPPNQSSLDIGSYQAPIEVGQKAARYKPGSQLLPLLENWTPQDTWKLQQQLVGIGVLDDDFRQGVWDPNSQNAFAEILSYSNGAGIDWRDGINKYNAGKPMTIDPKTGLPVKRTSGKKGQAPLVTRFTNPDDLATVANEVAQKRLGRTFSQDELNKFVSSFHGQEAGTQGAAYAAGNAAGGGVADAPTAQTAAETYAKQVDPVASTAMNVIPLIEGVNELMRGVSGTVEPMRG
jgi:hypothetical protein